MTADNLCMGCMKEIGNVQQCPFCGFHNDTVAPAPYLPLRTVIGGRYTVGKVISASGDGVTYIAWDTESRETVTVREFLPVENITRLQGQTEVTVNEDSRLVFYDSVREFLTLNRKLAMSRNLSALIPVIDIIEENNTAYAVSEYLETITLRDFLLKSRTGYLGWDRVKTLMMPVLTTVASLHSMDIYHRGISPNTLVLGRDGKLRLTGFMISSARCLKTRVKPEMFPGYAAIEQYHDVDDTGAWTDVYGIAAVIYRALIGSTPAEASERITNDKLMIPPRFAEALPAYLVSALDHALTIEPGDRTATVDELREELSGSPSTMASNAIHEVREREVEAPTTTEDEVAERKRLEKLARQEQQKHEQIKMALIAFAICLGIGVLAIGGWLTYDHFKNNPNEPTTEGVAQMIEVPNFVGQSYSRISNDEVQKTRFKFTVDYQYSDSAEAGVIIGQNLEAGTQIEQGSELKLTVSKGIEYVTLIDVSGMDYNKAFNLLTEAGFVCKKVEKNNDGSHTANEVITVTPEAGKEYERGKEIYVQVWGAPPTTATTTKKSLLGELGGGLF
ncbi:MAG: PASTA domain-containing protein [Ruminococcus sp.]|nr:PASTA domain-containing protein [Ruminococcus sp.]MDD7344098.1 PASTA domain-containing protein [Ruminococcus sp.]MDY6058900.1 PASTA domain-containing protein [Candidatus Fimenecus sp.]